MNNKVSLAIATVFTVSALSFTSTASAGTFFEGQRDITGGSYNSVPELDASGAPIALALVAGLAGLGIERRRRRKNKSDNNDS